MTKRYPLHHEDARPLYMEITQEEYDRINSRIAELEKENAELKEERRWRKFSEEKPSEEMEGMDFIVSNGFFHREISEWRGYWNNDPFCGDRHCEEVKYWRPLPSAPKENK